MESRKRPNIFSVLGHFIVDRFVVVCSQLGEELAQVWVFVCAFFKFLWRRFDRAIGRNFHRFATGASIEPAGLDNIGLVGQSLRAIYGATRVQSEADTVIDSKDDLEGKVRDFYRTAESANEDEKKGAFTAIADAQWSVESLGWAACDFFEREGDERGFKDIEITDPDHPDDPTAPIRWMEAIMHFGVGMYAMLPASGKDSPSESEIVKRVLETVDKWSAEEFGFLSWDGAGLLLAFAESGIRDLSNFYHVLGIPSFQVPDRNFVRGFLEALEGHDEQMLCRGYGRGLYFLNGSLNSALIAARRATEEHRALTFKFVVEGVSFAFAMVNANRPAAVIRGYQAVPGKDLEARSEVIGGIGENLFFNERCFPGFLKGLEDRHGLTLATLAAREQIETAERAPRVGPALERRNIEAVEKIGAFESRKQEMVEFRVDAGESPEEAYANAVAELEMAEFALPEEERRPVKRVSAMLRLEAALRKRAALKSPGANGG